MPKIKTNKSVVRRFKVTARGKLMRHRAGAGHLKSRKSPAQLRRFRKETTVSKGFTKQIKRMLGM